MSDSDRTCLASRPGRIPLVQYLQVIVTCSMTTNSVRLHMSG